MVFMRFKFTHFCTASGCWVREAGQVSSPPDFRPGNSSSASLNGAVLSSGAVLERQCPGFVFFLLGSRPYQHPQPTPTHTPNLQQDGRSPALAPLSVHMVRDREPLAHLVTASWGGVPGGEKLGLCDWRLCSRTWKNSPESHYYLDETCTSSSSSRINPALSSAVSPAFIYESSIHSSA